MPARVPPESPVPAAPAPPPLPAYLARTIAAGRLSPSYLLEGPDAEALRGAGRRLAAAILCKTGGCGRCRSCRLVAKGVHPDLHLVTKDKATVISVAALGPVLERAFLKPLEGARQVFLIDPAEAMEAEGLARYLKALEEPPEGTVFLLLSTRPERLPETVISRCRRVQFPPPSEGEIATALAAEGVADAPLAAHVATGSLARGRRMAQGGVLEAAASLAEAARAKAPGLGGAALRVLAALERSAQATPAEDGEGEEEGAAGRKREAVRAALQDLLHALAVDARDVVAGRDARFLRGATPQRAVDLLARLGELAGAVAANVTPAAVVIEIAAALRRSLA